MAVAPAPVVNDLTPNQLSSVRNYTGADTDDVELWIAHVERTQQAFDWSDNKTGQIAGNRLVDKAARFLEAIKTLNTNVDTWPNLKKELLLRFKKEQSDVTAALILGELQQGNTESVADFYDRCVMALKRKNHRVDDRTLANAHFQDMLKTDLYVFFAAGLKRYIRNATICSSAPPTTIPELLKAAKRVELQTEAKDKLFELEELDDQGKEGILDKAELQGLGQRVCINDKVDQELKEQINKLTEELQKLKVKRGRVYPHRHLGNHHLDGARTGLVCFNCNKPGHYARDCRQGRRTLFSNGSAGRKTLRRPSYKHVKELEEEEGDTWSSEEESGNE